jgi:hypothetical protein
MIGMDLGLRQVLGGLGVFGPRRLVLGSFGSAFVGLVAPYP